LGQSVKVLLDTNSLIWLLGHDNDNLLGSKAKNLIQDADAVYASSVNILEIRIKTMLGKLISDDDLIDAISSAGLKNLVFDMKHADALTNFPTLTKHDPFDRMLISQAQVEGMILLTSDRALLELDNSLTANSRK
jgi:PIN domain nuclease of toxin-antitoxin system